MKIEQIIKNLIEFNVWRCGGNDPMPVPKLVGDTIEAAVCQLNNLHMALPKLPFNWAYSDLSTGWYCGKPDEWHCTIVSLDGQSFYKIGSGESPNEAADNAIRQVLNV